MAVQIGILIVLLVGGVLIYRLVSKSVSNFMNGTVAAAAEEEDRPERIDPVGSVGPDGLIVLFGDRFVGKASSSKMVSPRQRCYAPLTEEELDPIDWAFHILYTTLATLYEDKSIDLRVVARSATLMPPYPQKTWDLELAQIGPMPESPMTDVMAVSFDLMRRKARDTEEEHNWVSLDVLVEQSLKTIRQELTFWQKAGVYGDLRQYVEAALVAQGYLIEPHRPTWLDKVRQCRPTVHLEGVLRLEPDAEALGERMAAFRATHGGNMLPEGGTEVEALKDVAHGLLSPGDSVEEIPMDEILRISIYETIQALRQLEPSGDAGV